MPTRAEAREGGPPTIRADALTFQPAGAGGPTPLRGLSFGVAPGDLMLVAGPTGCGKSTLLALIAGLGDRFPEPRVRGRLSVVFPGDNGAFGAEPLPPPRPGRVAWVRQEPGDGLLGFDVAGAIALPLEEQGLAPADTIRRVEGALDRYGVLHLAARDVATLSAGERRRVALAGVEALDAGLVLLDEPLAGLDPAGTRQVVADLHRLRERRTVVVAEHRVQQLRPIADQVLHLIPERAVGDGQALPISPPKRPAPTIVADGLVVRRGTRRVLDQVSCTIGPGLVGLLGPNGAGKTTLLATLAGLLAPEQGTVSITDLPVWAGRRRRPTRRERALRRLLAFDVQDPRDVFFEDTVGAELAAPLAALGLASGDEAEDRARRRLMHAGLADLTRRAPSRLSGGEARRVQMLGSLLVGPSVWFVDEPTHGLDPVARASLQATLQRFVGAGGTAIVATHEPELLPVDTRWLFLPGDGTLLEGAEARPGALRPRQAGFLEDARV